MREALTWRYAGWAAVLLTGLAACQRLELGAGVMLAVPPPDPVVEKQVEDARLAIAEAVRKAKEAGNSRPTRRPRGRRPSLPPRT